MAKGSVELVYNFSPVSDTLPDASLTAEYADDDILLYELDEVNV